MNITHIFLLTHGYWGETLKDSIELIIGNTENVSCFGLDIDMSLDQYYNNLQKEVEKKQKQGVLLIADVMGSSTYNVAARLCTQYNVFAITGLSAQILISAIENRDEKDARSLVEQLEQEGKKNIVNINKLLNK